MNEQTFPVSGQLRLAFLLAVIALIVGGLSFVKTTPFSSELGIAELSPRGPAGGSVIPASCPSYEHTAGECAETGGDTGGDTGGTGGGGSGGGTCTSNDCGTGDICKNLPGSQASVPTGYSSNTVISGGCLPTTCPIDWSVFKYKTGSSCDYCRNTSGTQNSGSTAYAAPSGYTIDTNGYCNAIVVETCDLQSNATTVTPADRVYLGWSCSQSASSAGLNFSTGGAANGLVSVLPGTTKTYTLQCSAGCQDSVTVTVLNPALSITANPTRVRSGDSSVISWSATEVSSCTVTGPSFSASGLTGSQSSGAITARSTYTLNCLSDQSSYSASVTVNLLPTGTEI